ncbi:MAG: hypothetical protein IJ679_00755 [Lachnospiraceae bacterium]|nr:hypothetical protein [Lachnospiraceae bacterium]
MAKMTKGYAFAYQVFGKYMWDAHAKSITDIVLAKADDALAKRVYNKIWSELSPNEKWFMRFIVEKESMPVNELLAITKKKHSDWSRPRKRLIEKGILSASEHGEVRLMLPRLREYVKEAEL